MKDFKKQPLLGLSDLELKEEGELAIFKGLVNGILLSVPFWLIIFIIVKWVYS